MPKGIESDRRSGEIIRQLFSAKSSPEIKKGRRSPNHRLAKGVGILAAGAVLAGFGGKELIREPREAKLVEAEQTQVDFYGQAKTDSKPLTTTGTVMFIGESAKIRENYGTYNGFPWFKPDNIAQKVSSGQELVVVNGIAREWGSMWTEFRLLDETWDSKPRNAKEFAGSMLAIHDQELAKQGLVTVCDIPGKGNTVAEVDENWVLRDIVGNPEKIATATLVDVHQAALFKAALADCVRLSAK